MNSMEAKFSSASKILVGISLDEETSMELLSWAIGIASHPNDIVVALHVLDGKDGKKPNSIAVDRTNLRKAKAVVIKMLGEFTEICQSNQVNLEAKVVWSSSVRKGLIEEATSLKASFLVIGGSRNRPQRASHKITSYCFKNAPEGCSMVAIRKGAQPTQDSDSESMPYEGLNQLSSRGSNKDTHIAKPLPSLQFNKNLSSRLSHTESISEKPSPRAVLDGPEGGSHPVPDYFSVGDSSTTESPPIGPKLRKFDHNNSEHRHSNIWKPLSMIKLLFPFVRSASEQTGNKSTECISNEESQQPSWRCFSYEEISHATNNFHPDNIVGRGGYAEVYRGNLYSGQTIAVKRLAKDNTDENKEKEFLTELGIIGHVCHPNTSYLVGCCIENGLHLIFDFSTNGSLASVLHGKNCKLLEWSVRYKIAIGVARGLHYLHKCCKHRIIHRDIKASNVLLGPDFEPQISDFGLAKWLPKQMTHHSVVPIEGTFGYLAPEYFMHGTVNEKTDVFAFGVLLLEIITGRRPVDESMQSLLLWAKPFIESGNIAELADPKLRGKYDIEQMQSLVLTASYCVRQSSTWRPSMSQVLQLMTDDFEEKWSWRIPECKVDEADDYASDVDYQFPTSPNSQEEL
ncbi:protein kinase superfamily protein [Tasmannia lanceolata]|uniref:protein kinase superfamily protein n=1 Tax=Tasmannia lanceolata TaxID=3420 RepID=UPI0040648331